jgi:hypothetical protein
MTKKRRTKVPKSIVDDLISFYGITPEKSRMDQAFWQRFAGAMRKAPMARELDPIERKILKEEPGLRRSKTAKPASRRSRRG